MKEYVLLVPFKDAKGKLYEKGDRIKLSDQSKKHFVNKIIDPSKVLVKNRNKSLLNKIKELEEEIDFLRTENSKLKQCSDNESNNERSGS